MSNFDIHILGCGSATPTMMHNPSSQVLNIREKLFMIDCGEGTQLQLRHNRLRFNKLNHIFITHLHGDHCFGLIGLISTLALLGRTGELVIHAHADLEKILRPQINYFCRDIPCDVKISPFNPQESKVIYEDRSMEVKTIPLKHRIPCAGFLFQEKAKEAHLLGEMIKHYKVPIKELARIKQGSDFVCDDGSIVPNARLTRPASPPRSYAYCSDTAYCESMVPIIENVDVLYHEATFAVADQSKAVTTGHSTAQQAAQIAKLANAKQLIIGHFSARYKNKDVLLQEAKDIFENTILANEGLCIKL